MECSVLVRHGDRCVSCKKYKVALNAMLNQWLSSATDVSPTNVSSRANFRYMSKCNVLKMWRLPSGKVSVGSGTWQPNRETNMWKRQGYIWIMSFINLDFVQISREHTCEVMKLYFDWCTPLSHSDMVFLVYSLLFCKYILRRTAERFLPYEW